MHATVCVCGREKERHLILVIIDLSYHVFPYHLHLRSKRQFVVTKQRALNTCAHFKLLQNLRINSYEFFDKLSGV